MAIHHVLKGSAAVAAAVMLYAAPASAQYGYGQSYGQGYGYQQGYQQGWGQGYQGNQRNYTYSPNFYGQGRGTGAGPYEYYGMDPDREFAREYLPRY